MTPDPIEGDRLAGAPHPRTRFTLVGHLDTEAELLSAWRSGRLPHAILLGGPEGIGKATLAYRMTRFVFARGETGSNGFDISPDHPVSRQVAALSHPDLLILRRVKTEDEKTLSKVIRVEDTRKIVQFFGSTAAYGGWRVCIVDAVEDMNASSANALLKLLEEPPPQCLFILISHAPGRLLPTIRSRCRRFDLKPLTDDEVETALRALLPDLPELENPDLEAAASASGGSVRRALSLLIGGGDGLEIHNTTKTLLEQLPSINSASIAALGDRLRGDNLSVFAETVEDWLAVAATRAEPPARLARYAEAWENVRRAAASAEIYNLDRKPLVFQVFAMLAEATRK